MNNYAIYLDLQSAKIYPLSSAAPETETLQRHEIKHHSGSDAEQDKHKHAEKFFNQVADHLKAADQILLMGHGQGKLLFQNHLEKHVPQLAKKIVDVEAVDHPTDKQIIALANKFFKKPM